MAASDARPVPRKNAAYRVVFPILDADGDLVSAAAGLDSEVSKDAGAPTDCVNEATEIGSSGMYYLDLTAAEMNADCVAILVKTSTSGAKTTPIVLYPEEAGDIRVNVTQISDDSTAADNAEAVFDGTGAVAANVTQIQGHALAGSGTQLADGFETFFDVANPAKTMNDVGATGDGLTAADVWSYDTRTLTAFSLEVTTDAASREASKADVSGLATAAALATVGGSVEAVQAKTDNLPASPAAVGSAMTLAAAERDSVADAVLARSVANVEAAAGEHTLCTIVLAMLEGAVSGSTWTIRRTDGSTTHATKTVTTDPDADPITGVA